MTGLLLAAALLLPLGLDTFALAAALGLAGLERRDRMRVTLVFTLFEAVMPVVGLVVGRAAGLLIGDWAGYLGVLVLALAGLLLLSPSKEEDAEAGRLRLLARARGPAILTLGLSISLDELTVGLSAGLLGLPIALAVVWIALQAFLVTQLGLRLGSRVGEQVRERAEWVAGAALIVVAVLLLALRLWRG